MNPAAAVVIDEVVALLSKDQLDDDHKFDFTDDKKKDLERAVSESETAIGDAKEGIATLTADIQVLNEGIVPLDASVADATEQRKADNDCYKTAHPKRCSSQGYLCLCQSWPQQVVNPTLHMPTHHTAGLILVQLQGHPTLTIIVLRVALVSLPWLTC